MGIKNVIRPKSNFVSALCRVVAIIPITAITPIIAAILLASCATPGPAPAGPTPEALQAQQLVQQGSPAAPGATPGQSAQNLVQSAPAPGGGFASTQSAFAPGAQTPAAQPYGAGITPEERAFLDNHLARLSYMVYFDEKSVTDHELAKVAVTQANRYLIEKLGYSVIDFDQIERNKKDQQAAYQAETGGSIDMIQYIAQKLNADVYVEISLKGSAEYRNYMYSASVQGAMKIFETSTATLLGSVAFASPPTVNPASAQDAMANAAMASVWQAMPRLTDQTKELMRASLSRGIRFELILQNTADAKAVSAFERSLGAKVKEVEKTSYSQTETRFSVFAFMTRGAVEKAIYDAAAAAGMKDAYLLYMRGKSFTFNSGL